MVPIYINFFFPQLDQGGHVFSVKTWREALQAGMEKTAEFWHRVLLRKHFTVAGGKEYGYQPRNRKYMISKANRWHHQNPLVWSGDLYRAVTGVYDRKVTGGHATIWLHPPPGRVMQGENLPDMVAELQTFSVADKEVLDDCLSKAVADHLMGTSDAGQEFRQTMAELSVADFNPSESQSARLFRMRMDKLG